MPDVEPSPKQPVLSVWADLRAGIRLIRGYRTLATLLTVVFVAELGFSGPMIAGVPLLANETGWGVRTVGWVLGGFGFGAAAGAGFLLWRRNIRHTGFVALFGLTAMGFSVVGLGLLPALWSHGTGAEVMQRIAVPMIGGMVSSTVLTLVVLLVVVGAALLALVSFAVVTTYDILFEVFASGRTPGKRMNGLRVVRSGGEPVRFVTSAIRNALRAIDFLPFAYVIGAVTILATRNNQRLGDIAAGTLVVRERRAATIAGFPADKLNAAGYGFYLQWLAVAAAYAAFSAHVPLPNAGRPRRPVLFVNPRSGGGKAERFKLADEARKRGIEPVELRSLPGILGAATAMRGRGIIQLGLLLRTGEESEDRRAEERGEARDDGDCRPDAKDVSDRSARVFHPG